MNILFCLMSTGNQFVYPTQYCCAWWKRELFYFLLSWKMVSRADLHLKIKAIQSLEMSGTIPLTTQYHIPEVSKSQQHTTSNLTALSAVRTMTTTRLWWAKHVAQMERNYKALYCWKILCKHWDRTYIRMVRLQHLKA